MPKGRKSHLTVLFPWPYFGENLERGKLEKRGNGLLLPRLWWKLSFGLLQVGLQAQEICVNGFILYFCGIYIASDAAVVPPLQMA